MFDFLILRTRFILGSPVCPACDFYGVRWTACRVHQLLNDLATRTYLGGNAIWFGYVSITLAFLGPLLLAKKIGRLTGRRRIRAVTLVSVIPSIVMLLILISSTLLEQVEIPLEFEPLRAILFFGMIQTLGTWLSCTLQEFNLERAIMKEEIQRSEKLKTLGEVAASIAHEVRNPLKFTKAKKAKERFAPSPCL
jgi:two-component system sporulation sensor kinase B